jgi:hypothetical protein
MTKGATSKLVGRLVERGLAKRELTDNQIQLGGDDEIGHKILSHFINIFGTIPPYIAIVCD